MLNSRSTNRLKMRQFYQQCKPRLSSKSLSMKSHNSRGWIGGLTKVTRLLLWLGLSAGFSVLGGCDAAPTLPQQGQWRIVNYWAIWCTPCREEIPVLNAVNRYADVVVLGVNFDRKTGEELSAHRGQLNIEFDSLTDDPTSFLGTKRPQALPTTLIVDPEGKLVRTLVGPQTQQTLDAALALAGRKKTPANQPANEGATQIGENLK